MQSPAPPPPAAIAVTAPTAPNGMTPLVTGLAHSPVPMALDPTPSASSATPGPTPLAPGPVPSSTENSVAYTQWLLSIIKSASGAPHDSGSPVPPAANSGAAHDLPTPSSLNGSHGSLPSLLGPAPLSLLDLASRMPSVPPNVPSTTTTNMSRPAQPPPASSLASDASHHPPFLLLDPYRPPSAAGIHPLLGTPSVTSSSSYMPPPPVSAHAAPSPARSSATAPLPPPPPVTEAQVLLLVAQAVRPLQEMQSMLVQSSHAASARLDTLDAEIRTVRTDLARVPPTSTSSAATDAAVRLLRDEVTALKEVLANERVDHAVLKHEVTEERAELARTLQAVKAERDELVALKEALGAERVALANLREQLEVEKTVAKVWSLIEDAPAETDSEARMGAVATPAPIPAVPSRAPLSEPGSPPLQIIEPPAPPPPPLIAVDPDPMLVDTPVPPAGFNAHVRSPTEPRHPNETTLAPAMDLGLPVPPVDTVAPLELVAAPTAPPPRDDVSAKPKRNQQQQRGDGQKARRGRGASNGTNSNRSNTNNQRKQNQARSKDRTSGGDAGDGGKKPLIDRYIPPTSSRARPQRDLPPPPRRPHDTDLRDKLPPRQYPEDLRDHLRRDNRDHRDREHPWRRAAIDTSPPPKRRRSLSPLPRPPSGPPPPHPRDAYCGGGAELDHAPQFGPDDIPDDAAYLMDYARGGRRGSVVHINPNHHAYCGNVADPYATAGYTDASAAGYYASPQPQLPVPPAPTGQYEYYQGYYDDAGFSATAVHPHAHAHSHAPHPPPDDLSALLDDDGGMEPPTAAMDVARLSEMLRAVQAASAGLQGGGSAEGL